MPSASHPVTEALSNNDIERRLKLLKAGHDPDTWVEPSGDEAEGPGEQSPDPGRLHEDGSPRALYRPWSEAADEYIHWSKNPHLRVYTGIKPFDDAMRGLAPQELMNVTGYSQGGKTLFTTQMLLHNNGRRVALFTPDETRVAVLVKMAAILHGMSAEELEERIAGGDTDTEDLLRDVARRHFPNFAVFDEITDLSLMSRALDESERVWGDRCQLAVIDYASLVTGQGEDIPSIFNAIKAFGKRRDVPLVVLNQASRSSGANGKKMTIDSGAYGGEQQSTFVVGVRRKREQYRAIIDDAQERLAAATQEATIARLEQLIQEAEYEMERHRNTVTFNLPKNKRPPCRLVDDTDFILDPDTGRVRPYEGEAAHAAVYRQEEF